MPPSVGRVLWGALPNGTGALSRQVQSINAVCSSVSVWVPVWADTCSDRSSTLDPAVGSYEIRWTVDISITMPQTYPVQGLIFSAVQGTPVKMLLVISASLQACWHSSVIQAQNPCTTQNAPITHAVKTCKVNVPAACHSLSLLFVSVPFSVSQAQLASSEEQRKSLEEQVTKAVSKGLTAEEELGSVNARMARYLHTDAELLSVSSALEQAGAEAGVQQAAVMQVCTWSARNVSLYSLVWTLHVCD